MSDPTVEEAREAVLESMHCPCGPSDTFNDDCDCDSFNATELDALIEAVRREEREEALQERTGYLNVLSRGRSFIQAVEASMREAGRADAALSEEV